MHESKDDELTRAEREALSALPQERLPSRLLEERTVRALREKGLLGRRQRRRFPAGWRATAVAAGLALFAAGTAFGQWLGSRQTANAIASAQRDEALDAALRVQQAGSAYLDALSALVEESSATGGTETNQKAREVALAVFRGVSDEIDRLQADSAGGAAQEVRHVIWF